MKNVLFTTMKMLYQENAMNEQAWGHKINFLNIQKRQKQKIVNNENDQLEARFFPKIKKQKATDIDWAGCTKQS